MAEVAADIRAEAVKLIGFLDTNNIPGVGSVQVW
jgi:hypothetical protein